MADIKQDLYDLKYSVDFALQGIQEADINLNLTPAAPPTATVIGTVTDGTNPHSQCHSQAVRQHGRALPACHHR